MSENSVHSVSWKKKPNDLMMFTTGNWREMHAGTIGKALELGVINFSLEDVALCVCT